MKIFANKRLVKIITIICLFVSLFTFCVPTVSRAETDGYGGKLLKPIVNLIAAIGDAIVGLEHKVIMGQESPTLIEIAPAESNWWKWIVGIVVGVLIVGLILFSHGMLLGVLKAAAVFIGKKLATGAAIGALLWFSFGTDVIGLAGSAVNGVASTFSKMMNSSLYLPSYSFSAQEIFEGKILLFDPNFFNPKEVKEGNNDGYKYYYFERGEGEKKEEIQTSPPGSNFSGNLQGVISTWYYNFRNFVIVLMLSILVYIGIRMTISSIASEKSKYKQFFMDWVVGMCLLFVLHYIMIFSVYLVEKITLMISTSYDKVVNVPAYVKDSDDAIIKKAEEMNGENDTVNIAQYVQTLEDGKKAIMWPTNLMGHVRILGQSQDDFFMALGYTLCFVALAFLSLFYCWIYIKRAFMLAFLTIIAPFVAFTYALDKMNDGKAQAFNMWLREYLFNLIIQPFHLILYTVFVSAVSQLSNTNPLYLVAVLALMMPAEKLLRKMFGFEKAQTPGLLSGAAGAAIVMNGMRGLTHFGKGKPEAKGGNTANSNTNNSNNIRVPSMPGYSVGVADIDGIDNTENNNQQNENGDVDDNAPPPGDEDVPPENNDEGYFYGNDDVDNNITLPRDEDIPTESSTGGFYFSDGDVEGIPSSRSSSRTNDGVQESDASSTSVPRTVNVPENNDNSGETNSDRRIRRKLLNRAYSMERRVNNLRNSKGITGIKKFTGSKPVRAIGRFAAGTIGAGARAAAIGTMGAVGAAVGIASGDVGNIAKYGAAGVTVGNAVAGNIINNTKRAAKGLEGKQASIMDSSAGVAFRQWAAIDENGRSTYAEDERKRQFEKAHTQYVLNDEEDVKYTVEQVKGASKEKVKQFRKDNSAVLAANKINKKEDFAAIYKMMNPESGKQADTTDIKEAIRAVKINEKLNELPKEFKTGDRINWLSDKLQRKGLSKDVADREATKRYNLSQKVDSYKKNFT